ncbi:hypothetical protein AAFF_G00286870 [Aldrovandia affinis]|uniref:Uncharacterized protein n=1 Tax=Aldrovandia affinis TaxID=143900 RepID=A0AAD7TAQ9_9TELE|nr:hypothetical protein AAFF_G00286870 [Aldrovandia affinis]
MVHVIPFASYYTITTLRPMQLFGKGPEFGYMSLFTYHGPRTAPRPRMAYHAPKMTLRQICHLLRVMRQEADQPPPAPELTGEKMPPDLLSS